METIKISVEVNVNLSEATQKFLSSLFTNRYDSFNVVPYSQTEEVKEVVVKKPEDEKKPTATAPAAAPAQTKQDAKPAPSAPAAPAASSASKSIEDVRGMLAKKVNEHRDVIKQKLNELGAPSVTKLDPSKYDEMYNFLSEL